MIDCPGVVPPSMTDTEEDLLMRGVVRLEKVENPAQYMDAVFARVKPHYLERTYQLKGFDNDPVRFLELLARKAGRLLKGGEPDLDSVAKMVLTDMLRGRLPWYTPPPMPENGDEAVVAGRSGRLGEMPLKRKRDQDEEVPDASTSKAAAQAGAAGNGEEEEDESFDGFDSDSDSDEEAIEEAKKEAVASEVASKKRKGEEDMIPLEELSDEED